MSSAVAFTVGPIEDWGLPDPLQPTSMCLFVGLVSLQTLEDSWVWQQHVCLVSQCYFKYTFLDFTCWGIPLSDTQLVLVLLAVVDASCISILSWLCVLLLLTWRFVQFFSCDGEILILNKSSFCQTDEWNLILYYAIPILLYWFLLHTWPLAWVCVQ